MAEALAMLFGSFLGNQAGSAINTHRAWKYYKKQMALNDYYNRRFTKDFYGLNRQSLESAGYNPLYGIAGSTAQGANYSASMMNSDSDAGDQAINSALNAVATKANVNNIEQNTGLLKEQKKGQELENRLKEKELNTSPRAIISDIISGNESKPAKAVKKVLKTIGVDTDDISSAVTSNNNQNPNLVKNAFKSWQGYKDWFKHTHPGTYKFLSNLKNNSKSSAVSNQKRDNEFFEYLSDKDLVNYSKKYGRKSRSYSRPPKEQLH